MACTLMGAVPFDNGKFLQPDWISGGLVGFVLVPPPKKSFPVLASRGPENLVGLHILSELKMFLMGSSRH